MKKYFNKLFTLLFLFFALFITSCNETTKYTISVINGTGSGEYEEGKYAIVMATIPEYKDFDYWELNGEKISNSNPLKVTVSSNATYKAVFKSQEAVIKVNDGQGGGTFEKGTQATIKATPPVNKVFDHWEVNGENVSSQSPYTFTVTKDATYNAVFKNARYVVNLTNGTGAGTYDAGTKVTITANEPEKNYVFDHWEVGGVSVSTNNPYTFNVSKSATYTAIYKKLENRGIKKTNAEDIEISPIAVSLGGTITIDYKYIDPVADKDNGITLFFGTDLSNCFGSFKIFEDHLNTTYTGIKFTALNDGYNRLTIDVSKLYQVPNGSNKPLNITTVLFKWFEPTNGVYFDVTSEPTLSINRGSLYKNADSPIYFAKTYNVNDGGTIIIDYKYADPLTDKDNGVSLFFGTDDTYRFGNYKIFRYNMETTYSGITFTQLEDGYNRITIDISLLNTVRSECIAPSTITQLSFRWFEASKGVYFDVNPQDKKEKTTEFQMDGDSFVIANFTDIHVDNIAYLSDTGSVGKTIKYAIQNSNPDIMIFSGDITGKASDLNYICTYLDSFKIPYFFILGNHDHEGSLGYDTIAQRVNQSEYGYIEKGPEDLGSQGNYTIKIKNSNGELVHAIVLMDTGNKYTVKDDALVEYVTNQVSGVKYGTYNNKKTYCDPGWNGLRGNQIDWYKDTVEALNCETTLICHIPFLEFCKAYEKYQNAVNKRDQATIAECAPIGDCVMGEQICGSMENLGMFDAILELGSTKNVICGHDHLNDFSLVYEGVRLTYALKTGEGAYWKADGTRCGYTELVINNDGTTALDQIYINPLSK